ncbi:hypothetical protein [Methanogenium organophilum]|uniref:Uncharacterized protein n=1 Tax=Methanogenium organophilum TaxID=2199 RepID=A0A9X9S2Z4_METOG|nr:hypothetical protein [Methanogenium organophilum]WAI00547.1 hypothetical protein OU421_08905 [Methanogenium organophilum]
MQIRLQRHRRGYNGAQGEGVRRHAALTRHPGSYVLSPVVGEGAAVYYSREQRASLCEACYARLVREWNMSEGVV